MIGQCVVSVLCIWSRVTHEACVVCKIWEHACESVIVFLKILCASVVKSIPVSPTDSGSGSFVPRAALKDEGQVEWMDHDAVAVGGGGWET